jgi:hypothetical protein
VKFKLYHYHIEHALMGKLACVLVACHADSPVEKAQTVAEQVMRAAYSRPDANPVVRLQFELGIISIKPQVKHAPLELDTTLEELGAMQFVGAGTGELMLLIEGDEQHPAAKPTTAYKMLGVGSLN